MDLEKKIAEHKAEIAKLTEALHLNRGALFAFEEMLKERDKPNPVPRGNLADANGQTQELAAGIPD